MISAFAQGARVENQNAGALTGKELGLLLEKFKSGNVEASLIKEILDIVKDVRQIQSNQVQYMLSFYVVIALYSSGDKNTMVVPNLWQ